MMRKFLLLVTAALMAFAVVSCTSCNNSNVQFGVEYSLQSSGVADGNLDIIFEGGSFTMDGSANYAFAWSNAVLFTKADTDAVVLDTALAAKDAEVATAAAKVNEWVNNSIKVTSASGTYDIYVKGYVKETVTQITFSIDRHFTNKENSSQ